MENQEKTSKDKKDVLSWVSITLLVVGGLNWGLVGLFGLDLVKELFGDMTVVSRVVYVLVGASALYELVSAPRFCKK